MSTTVSNAVIAPREKHDAAIRLERVKILYHAGANGLLGGYLVLFFFSLFMWERLEHTTLLIWIGIALLANIPRIFLIRRFTSRLKFDELDASEVLRWERYFSGWFLASGLVWGSTPFLAYQDDLLLNLLFVIVVLIGMSAVIVLMYSSSRNMVMVYISVTILPVMIKLFKTMDYSSIVVACTGFAYFIILFRAIIQHHKNLIENITLKISNQELSRKDSLTGLSNRRHLQEFLEKLIPGVERTGEPFSIFLMDIDHFKNYNDTRGHNEGDRALALVASIIKQSIRAMDFAVRYGGEEFLVVLPQTNLAKATVIAERLRATIEAESDVTVSGGIAQYTSSQNFTELASQADTMLYRAKHEGRNRVHSHDISESIIDD